MEPNIRDLEDTREERFEEEEQDDGADWFCDEAMEREWDE